MSIKDWSDRKVQAVNAKYAELDKDPEARAQYDAKQHQVATWVGWPLLLVFALATVGGVALGLATGRPLAIVLTLIIAGGATVVTARNLMTLRGEKRKP